MIPKYLRPVRNYCNLPCHWHAWLLKGMFNTNIMGPVYFLYFSSWTGMSGADYDKLHRLEYIYLRNGKNHLFKIHLTNNHLNMLKLFHIILIVSLCVVNMTKNRHHLTFQILKLQCIMRPDTVQYYTASWKISGYLFIFIFVIKGTLFQSIEWWVKKQWCYLGLNE